MEKDLQEIEGFLKSSLITQALQLLQKLLAKHRSNLLSLRIILDRLYGFAQSLINCRTYKPIVPLFKVLERICIVLNDTSRQCDLKNNLSFSYRALGQTSLALKESLEALEIAGDKKGLVSKLPALHLNTCAIFREDLKDLVMAKTHAELAFFFAKENCINGCEKDKKTLAVAYYNYALVLEELNDRHSIVWYRDGLRYCEDLNDLQMEQAFRLKLNNLQDSAKRAKDCKSKAKSQRRPYKFGVISEVQKIHRPTTRVKRIRITEKEKFSLVPFSSRNNPQFPLENLGFHSATSKTRPRLNLSKSTKKLSLVQSVIKLQKWYRRIKNLKRVSIDFLYTVKGVKAYNNFRYFISVFQRRNNSDKFIEAWPLTKGCIRPKDLAVDRNLGSGYEYIINSKSKQLLDVIEIIEHRIIVNPIELIFEGDQDISHQPYHLKLWFFKRTLLIEASSSDTCYECSISLDPFQDSSHLKLKLSLILQNLSISSGKLIFSLI